MNRLEFLKHFPFVVMLPAAGSPPIGDAPPTTCSPPPITGDAVLRLAVVKMHGELSRNPFAPGPPLFSDVRLRTLDTLNRYGYALHDMSDAALRMHDRLSRKIANWGIGEDNAVDFALLDGGGGGVDCYRGHEMVIAKETLETLASTALRR